MARPETAHKLASMALWGGNIPAQTLEVTRLSIMDWLAVGRAGSAEPVAEVTRNIMLSEGGHPQAAGFGTQTMLPMRAAALLNGTVSHALDYDDTHFAHIGHTSVAVMPAAFAVGQAQNANLDDVIQAAAIGSEVAIRAGLWLGRDHYLAGWHQTATSGAFGAAAASGRLLGLTPDQMTHAMAILGTRASGARMQFGTMGKPLNAGFAAANGVEAALFAKAGLTSNPEGLDGDQGFAATHSSAGQVLDGFAKDWLFDAVQHKFHACCHGIHAALEALASLDVDHATRVDVQINPRWMSVCNKPAPTTGLEAKFSYKHVLALALAGHPTSALGVYSDALCADPTVLALRECVHVTANAQINDGAAIVTVDGSEARFDLADPIPLEQRRRKVEDKASTLIGGEALHAIQTAFQMNSLSQLSDFIRNHP